jgi:hypothetical protein
MFRKFKPAWAPHGNPVLKKWLITLKHQKDEGLESS